MKELTPDEVDNLPGKVWQAISSKQWNTRAAGRLDAIVAQMRRDNARVHFVLAYLDGLETLLPEDVEVIRNHLKL